MNRYITSKGLEWFSIGHYIVFHTEGEFVRVVETPKYIRHTIGFEFNGMYYSDSLFLHHGRNYCFRELLELPLEYGELENLDFIIKSLEVMEHVRYEYAVGTIHRLSSRLTGYL